MACIQYKSNYLTLYYRCKDWSEPVIDWSGLELVQTGSDWSRTNTRPV